ncbi:MAG: TonB-denpendent receptor [Caulobacteraceae bacterium]|nr:TonB-denpendent receptor [Caulobacteraceae bacterium]
MKLVAALCGGVSLLAVGSAAHAQQAAAPNAPAAQPSSTIDMVVVTGSRIVRNGYAAPTPVTVAPAAQLEAITPTDISDALVKLPVFNGSVLQGAGSNGSGVSGNYLNLRSFGINRTLILMDGLRVAPTNFNGQVDANAIPQMLIQRVDVVTGGASAVYGSDAVTGVVNFVMDTHFQGLKAVAQSGISSRGDSASARYGVAGGTALFGGKAHVVGSFEHFQEGGLIHEQRSYGVQRPVYVGSGTAASPYTLLNYPTIPRTAAGGYVLSGPFAGQQFLSNGQLGAYTPGAATASANVSAGGDGSYYNRLPLYSPQASNQGYGRFEYEFTDDITGFVQLTGTETHNSVRASNWPPQTLAIYSGNAYLPASAQSLLTATNTASFNLSSFPRDLELDSVQNQLSDNTSVTAGLTGKFSGYKWAASYSHGQSIFRQSLTNNINVPNFLAALDAVKDPSGNTVCRVTITNPGLYPGCAPIDMFGAGNESAAAKAFIYQTTQFQVMNTMDDFVASLSGSPFQDWAGPVSIALNAEYRTQGLKETTNANPLAAPSTTGIRFGTAPGSIYAYATVAGTNASNNVKEVSAETVVPLLSEQPWAKSLDISGAVRYTDYSSSGGATTWKIGLDYRPVSDLRFRATESQDIRAPTLFDLNAGQSTIVQNLNDPHTGVNRVVTIITLGNPKLVPEVARTTTAGVVYSPSWLPRFRMSVDYYDISINNAITLLAGNNAAVLSECEQTGGTSPICSLIVRPLPYSNTSAANFPTTVYQKSLNIAKNQTHGVDVEASYNVVLADVQKSLTGDLNFRVLYSYQPVLYTQNFPGAPVTNLAGAASQAGLAGLATDRVTFMLGYGAGPFQLDWQTRYSGPEKRSGVPGQIFANPPLPSYSTSDLNLGYRLKLEGHVVNLFFNVQNVFDAKPRLSPNLTYAGIPGFGNPVDTGDDGIGRYFTAGLRFRY